MSIYSQCLQVADSFGPVNDEKFLDQVLQCRELLNIAHSLHPPKTLNILNIKTLIDRVLQWRTLKITRPCRNLWNSWTIIQLYVYHIGAMSFADLLRFSFWFLSFNSSVLPDLFNSSMLADLLNQVVLEVFWALPHFLPFSHQDRLSLGIFVLAAHHKSPNKWPISNIVKPTIFQRPSHLRVVFLIF